MGISKKWKVVIGLVVVVVALITFGFNSINDYQQSGELNIKGLNESVRIVRDEKGMAYIYANNEDDIFFAQGFIAAQDRLFSMELVKRIAAGRLNEVFGEGVKKNDLKMRTLGFHRNAKKHAELLSPKERNRFQKYVDGVNAYIKNQPSTIHLKLKIAGIKPSRWKIADSLAILYYMGWGSSANLGDEIISQLLIEKLGPEKAAELFPLNINPEDPSGKPLEVRFDPMKSSGSASAALSGLLPLAEGNALRIGSNNWVVSPGLSKGDKPVLANDPHLDTRIIPGPFYPVGLITPDFRAIGVTVAGSPGMVIGRTGHIAMGITNGYGDIQDLYVETIDPGNTDNYLEGNRSIPFKIIAERLKIKDKEAESGFREEIIKIRLTKRGPVVSDVFPDLKSSKLFSLRWSPYESMGPDIGLMDLLTSKNVSDARNALSKTNMIMLNFVLADTEGNFAWQTTGKIPIRDLGDGMVPYVVKSSRDNWRGWIPWEQMPHSINPEKGWTGTCNHTTVTNDYPFYFSSHFSPSWRLRRLMQLLSKPGKKTIDDHWAFQRDTKNMMAERIAPIFADVLKAHPKTQQMGEVLADWNYKDDPELAAPSVFQVLFRELVLQTYADELGDKLTMTMAKNWYYWQERLVAMIEQGGSSWFDDTRTADKTETLDDMILQAGLTAQKSLTDRFGDNVEDWIWGEMHRMEYVSALRRSGFGKGLVGGGSHAMGGSGETLYRGLYLVDKPYNPAVTASLRMVVDLADPDKILAVLPSGVSGRLFDSHRTDQIEPFMNGEKRYWWFSDKAIKEHTESELVLFP